VTSSVRGFVALANQMSMELGNIEGHSYQSIKNPLKSSISSQQQFSLDKISLKYISPSILWQVKQIQGIPSQSDVAPFTAQLQ
jgi:hypothetical protein